MEDGERGFALRTEAMGESEVGGKVAAGGRKGNCVNAELRTGKAVIFDGKLVSKGRVGGSKDSF
jgi:hypothetical protein